MVLPSSNSRQAQAAAPASKGRGATAGCGPSIWVGIFSLGKWANWLTDARARQNGLNLCTYVQKGNWRTCVRAATLTALCLHAPRVNTLSCAGSAAAAASLRPLPRATARLLAMTSGAGTETARLGQLWRGA